MSVECLMMGNLGLPAAAGSMTMITYNMPGHSILPSRGGQTHPVWKALWLLFHKLQVYRLDFQYIAKQPKEEQESTYVCREPCSRSFAGAEQD